MRTGRRTGKHRLFRHAVETLYAVKSLKMRHRLFRSNHMWSFEVDIITVKGGGVITEPAPLARFMPSPADYLCGHEITGHIERILTAAATRLQDTSSGY